MPCLEFDNLKAFNSPISRLIGSVALSPCLLAPEKRGVVEDIIARHNLKLYLHYEERTFTFNVLNLACRIFLGIPTLERLWSLAYAYFVFYELIHKAPEGKEVTTLEHDCGSQACGLLLWAMHEELRHEREIPECPPFPSDLPAPGSNADRLTPIIDELFLCMVGWMLLHEMAHIELGHNFSDSCPVDRQIKQEWEADDWACDHVLSSVNGLDFTESRNIKRALGVTFGLSALTGIEVHPEGRTPVAHPHSIDRLIHFLDRTLGPENPESASRAELPWYAAASIVAAQLSVFKRGGAPRKFAGFRDLLEYARSIIPR